MEQRLTTDVRTEINIVKKLILGITIVGCLITLFILFGNLVTTDTLASNPIPRVKYNVSGNAQNKKNQRIWDILSTGDTIEITEQLKLKSNLNLSNVDIVLFLNGGELMWMDDYTLTLSDRSEIIRTAGGVLVGNQESLSTGMCVRFGKKTVITWNGNNGSKLSFSDINNSRGYSDGLLPVVPELLYFKSVECPDGIRLKWATSAEISNRCFEIQHSRDGEGFSTVNIVPGSGTTTGRSEYEYIYNTTSDSSQIAYFRLKQVNFSGESTTSPVVIQLLTSNSVLADNSGAPGKPDPENSF